jgi:selT/selW/selH-like putative selenoprotein
MQRYFDPLAVALEDEFPGQVEVKGVRDPQTTGNFEVVIQSTGELIHSKSKHGQGKCETQEERDAVIEKIRAHLATL